MSNVFFTIEAYKNDWGLFSTPKWAEFRRGSFWMGPTTQNGHRKFSFALKHVNARREITKSSFFEDLGLRIEIWRSGGLEFKWNFDADPLEILPDPKTGLKNNKKSEWGVCPHGLFCPWARWDGGLANFKNDPSTGPQTAFFGTFWGPGVFPMDPDRNFV